MSGQTKYVKYEDGMMVVYVDEGYVLTPYIDGEDIQKYISFKEVRVFPNISNYTYIQSLRVISDAEDEAYLNSKILREQEIINMFLDLNNVSGVTF